MKLNGLPLIVVTFLILFIAGDGWCRTFHYPEFTIELPESWDEIPYGVMRESENALRKQTKSVTSERYKYGFQESNINRWFSYPYILIQVDVSGRIQESKLVQMANKSLQKSYENQEKKLDTFISRFKDEEKVYDSGNKILWLRASAFVNGVGEIAAITAVLPTENGCVRIYCYCTIKDYEKVLPIFREIVNSVVVDESNKYKITPYDSLPPVLSQISWPDVLGKAIGGAVVGGIFSFFAYRRGRSK